MFTWFSSIHKDGKQMAHVPKGISVGSESNCLNCHLQFKSEIITQPTGPQEHNHGKELNLYRFALSFSQIILCFRWGCQLYFSFIMAGSQTLNDSMRLSRQRHWIRSLICPQSCGCLGFVLYLKVTIYFAKFEPQFLGTVISEKLLALA